MDHPPRLIERDKQSQYHKWVALSPEFMQISFYSSAGCIYVAERKKPKKENIMMMIIMIKLYI